MKKHILLFIVLLSLWQTNTLHAQVIRKNYRELTDAERQTLVAAFFALGPANGTSTINTYAVNHRLLFNTSIHRDNDFLPWHRWFILYMEKALQNTAVTGASKIALPYWDSTVPADQTSTAPLWANNFLGQFNSSWGLGRRFLGGWFGSASILNTALLQTNFTNFRAQLEENLHDGPHVWVDGQMAGGESPRDPVFYFHHNMVDKIWQDWEDLQGRNSSFLEENLPNSLAGGAGPFPAGVPTVTPSSIRDSRASSVKVWFAENGKVILDRYTVAGTENYHYTGVIEAGNRQVTARNLNGTLVTYDTGAFTVPSGTSCHFLSGGLQLGNATEAGVIRLLPGFSAQAGSTFSARINSEYFTNAASGLRTQDHVLAQETLEEGIHLFPNPTSSRVYIQLPQTFTTDYRYTLLDAFGKTVAGGTSLDQSLDMQPFATGMYMLVVHTKEGKTLCTRIIRQ